MTLYHPRSTLVLITVYRDKGRVAELLQALASQSMPVGSVLVVDNSPEPVFKDLQSLVPYPPMFELSIIHRPDNAGITGAILEGLAIARKQEFNYLWLMDHDSIPSAESHEQLREVLDRHPDVGLAACLPMIEPTGKPVNGLLFKKYRFEPKSLSDGSGKADYCECDAVITSGSLLHLERLTGISVVDPDLFIDAVDHDLCLRIRNAGFRILIVKTAIMQHQLGRYTEVWDSLKRRHIELSSYSYLRLYYICRNHTMVEMRAARGIWKIWTVGWRVRFCLWQIRMNFLEKNGALKKSMYCVLGTYHGFCGKRGQHPLSSVQTEIGSSIE